MEARAYGATRVRTLCYPTRLARRDIYWLSVAGLLLALGVVSRVGMG